MKVPMLPIAGMVIFGAANSAALAKTIVVAQKHAQAADDNPGTEAAPLKTISKAAQLAQPGDIVLVHEGIYRERVAPARGGELGKPIVYQAAPGEHVAVRGSEVYRGKWEPVAGKPGLFTTTFDAGFFPTLNPFAVAVRSSRGRGTLGQVFFDGRLMSEAKEIVKTDPQTKARIVEKTLMQAVEEQPGTWTVESQGQSITLHVPDAGKTPEQYEVEISVRQRVFAPVPRGLMYIHVRGLVFEHACNHVAVPFQGMVSTRNGRYWLIENCTIRLARSVGLECGQEWGIPALSEEWDNTDLKRWVMGRGYHVIRNNVVTDNGQTGIAGLKSPETRITGNIVERNALIVPGFESAGIKMHLYWDGHVEGNLVRDNGSYGIWYDNGWEGARIARNVVINNKYNGIFVELGEDRVRGGLVDNNVIAHNRGPGLYTHDSSDVWLVNNLLLSNDEMGAYLHLATGRRGFSRWHDGRTENACSRERLFNNLFVNNAAGEISLPSPGGRSLDCLSDANVFVPPDSRPIRFTVNPNNGLRVGADALSAEAKKAFETSGDPALADTTVQMTKGGMTVTMPQWRALLKSDANSAAGVIHCNLDRQSLVLTMDVQDLPDIATRSAVDADRDLLNNLVPRTRPLPGPFQNLTKGKNTYTLWPVKIDSPQDVEERAAAHAEDDQIQMDAARFFMAMAPVQANMDDVVRMAAMGRQCLARIKSASPLAGRATATDYRLMIMMVRGEEAVASLQDRINALSDNKARREAIRFLGEAMEHEGFVAAVESLLKTDTTGEELRWACDLAAIMAADEAQGPRRKLLTDATARWTANARAAAKTSDEQARIDVVQARVARTAGDAEQAKAFFIQAAQTAQDPAIKASSLCEAGRLLLSAKQTDEAKELLEQAANIADGGKGSADARALLEKLSAPSGGAKKAN